MHSLWLTTMCGPQPLDGLQGGRYQLAHTAADAEIIGVIDADYVVRPDWLRDLVRYVVLRRKRIDSSAAKPVFT